MLSGSVGFAKVMAGQRAGSIHTGEEAPFDIGQGEQAVLLYRIYNDQDNTPPGAMFGPDFHKNSGRNTPRTWCGWKDLFRDHSIGASLAIIETTN